MLVLISFILLLGGPGLGVGLGLWVSRKYTPKERNHKDEPYGGEIAGFFIGFFGFCIGFTGLILTSTWLWQAMEL